MEKIVCDNCDKKNCDKRVAGAVCFYNKETRDLVDNYKTRDPELIANSYVRLIQSEMNRYYKAVEAEGVGEVEEVSKVDKNGNTLIFNKRKKLDNAITTLADKLIKNGKLLHDLVNPPKKTPLIQQNLFNIKNVVADDVQRLNQEEKQKVLKFLEAKIDEKDN